MKDEKDGRKRTIAQAFNYAGMQATVYRAGPHYRNERQRRSACLRVLVEDHANLGEARIVLAEDETMVKFDNQRLIEYTPRPGCRDTLQSLHHARSLARTADFLHELQGLCAAHGILVVYVAEIDKCRISGATCQARESHDSAHSRWLFWTSKRRGPSLAVVSLFAAGARRGPCS